MYTLHFLVGFLLSRILLKFGSIHVISLELGPMQAPKDGGADIRPATPADVEALVANRPSDSGSQEFTRGSEVWVAVQAGKLVAYDICGAQTKTLSDFIRLEAPERDTWAIGIWVAPEARGQGLAVQLRRRVAQEFRDRGLAHLLGTISATNKRSIHTFKKIGAKFIGRVDYVCLFGFGVVRFDGKVRAGRWSSRRPLTLAISPDAEAGPAPAV